MTWTTWPTASSATATRKPRSTLTLGLLLALPAATLFLLWSSFGADTWSPLTAHDGYGFGFVGFGTSLTDESTHGGGGLVDLSSLRVGLQDGVVFHEEVFGAALYSFAKAGAELSTYHPPYRAGFSLVTGPLFAGRPPFDLQPPVNIVRDLKQGALDVAVVTSADDGWLDEAVLEALVEAKQTQAVLFFHQMSAFGKREQREALRPLARERRLTVVGLGEVVTKQLSSHLAEWALVDPDSAWSDVPVELFIPIFPVPISPDAEPRHKVPSRVVIQGGIVHSRRKYHAILADLRAALVADPTPWGYRPSSFGGAFEPIPRHPDVFTLHLLGFQAEPVDVPAELDNVVVFSGNGHYRTYFDELQSMDLLVPAFASNDYLESKTSSSIPAGILAGVPVLASVRHLAVYDYLRPPAAVSHPSGMTEVEAIRRLRSGEDLWSQASKALVPVEWLAPVNQDAEAWDVYRGGLYASNEAAWARVAARVGPRSE